MLDRIKNAAVTVDETLIEKVLRKQYQKKGSCRLVARLAAGATVADVLDGNDDTEGGTARSLKSLMDFGAGLAMMDCIGMSPVQILGVYVGLLVLLVYVYKKIRYIIPDELFKNCQVCSNGKCRQGTEKECWLLGLLLESIISLAIGIVTTVFIHSILIFVLKMQVYKLSALFLETVARKMA